jgi:hypothetical protein
MLIRPRFSQSAASILGAPLRTRTRARVPQPPPPARPPGRPAGADKTARPAAPSAAHRAARWCSSCRCAPGPPPPCASRSTRPRTGSGRRPGSRAAERTHGNGSM